LSATSGNRVRATTNRAAADRGPATQRLTGGSGCKSLSCQATRAPFVLQHEQVDSCEGELGAVELRVPPRRWSQVAEHDQASEDRVASSPSTT
jgi:hypothetical protein